jgi:hypothetical protein
MALTKTPIELSSTPGIVDNSNATAITIDSSENVMVNRTSVFTTAKMEIQSDASDASTLALNSIDTDGSMLEFYKAGSTVGNIGSTSGTHLYAGSGDVGLLFQGTANAIEPWNPATNGARDNAIDLGLSGNRFKDIYLSGGVNFSANANAGGMTSETLNDYEEGTWTPTHSDGTALSIVGLARYTKIGNAVSINIDVSFTKTSAGISGLPFTSVTNTNQTFNVGYSSTSNNVNYGHMNPSTATIDAWYNTTNGSATFVNGDRVMVGGTYFTDS